MKKHPLIFALAALLLVSLACISTPSPAPQDPGQVETMVAQTLTALTPAAQPPTPVPPAASSCQPPHPGLESVIWPAGFGVGNGDTGDLKIYDTRGNLLSSHNLPGLTPYAEVHFGSLNAGTAITYYTFDAGGEMRVYRPPQLNTLVSNSDFVWLRGANGSESLVYVVVTSNAAGTGWQSSLFTANAQTLTAAASPSLFRDMADGYIHRPLLVRAANGQAVGLWYTLSMWGIGDINWAPYSGLYYADLTTGQTTQFLGADDRLLALSPDGSLAAFAPNGSQNRPGDALVIRDMARTCQDIRIPWEASSNQGGGQAAISPDNGMIAWVEASGPDAMSATFRLRVAKLSNGSYTDLVNTPVSQLSGLGGGVAPESVYPLAWLDDHVLLLGLYLPGNYTMQLVLWAPDPNRPLDPALGANQSVLVAAGDFVGLLYP